MDSDKVQIVTAIAQSVLALAALIASIVLYYGARKLTKLQYMRSSFDAWMTLDTFLLSNLANQDLITMARKIERPDLAEPVADQKRLLGFIILNPYVSYYYAIKHGLIDKSFEQTINTALSKIVIDEDVYRLTQEEIFAEGFADHCRRLKSEQRDDI